jgi:hypothetical protein
VSGSHIHVQQQPKSYGLQSMILAYTVIDTLLEEDYMFGEELLVICHIDLWQRYCCWQNL